MCDILEAEGQGERQPAHTPEAQLRILPTSKKRRRRAGGATTGSGKRVDGAPGWILLVL